MKMNKWLLTKLLFLLCLLPSSQALAETLTITGTIRDFRANHEDFDINWGHNWWAPTTGLVAADLGSDKKPVLVSVSGENDGDINQVISSPASFGQWFNNVQGVNRSKELNITLEQDGGFFVYDSAITPTGNAGGAEGFFPIDGELFGDQGSPHNYHFTFEVHSQFTYTGGESFTFSGDDDVWLYVDNKLVIDLGGLHTRSTATVSLDTLGLTVGQRYDFDFFYAERRATQSNFAISTDIKLGMPVPSISGSVFSDDNTNDTFDDEELGLANILVWAQRINADGSVDPLQTAATTDAQGNYQLSGLANGNYQVQVDTDDTDLPTDHIIGSTNPLLVTVIDGGISNVDFGFDKVVCSAFTGEVSELSLPLTSQLKTTDKMFVPSRDVASATGHLRAYSVDSTGDPSELPVWEAATLMAETNRTAKLFSTNSAGNIVAFESLTEVSETVKNHRASAPLGSISRGNDLDLATQKLDVSLYLSDLNYRDFYTSTVATRDQMVLMSSDDGFLYAFDYSSGALKWAWMPRSLQSELASNDNHQDKHLMDGSVDILDLNDGSGSYASYIVGAYKGGLGRYVLKLNADGSLGSVVWDDDQSNSFNQSPNSGEMEFFRSGAGTVYAAYVLSNSASANTSQLKIRSLVDNADNISVNLNYQATSTPFVMPDYDKRNAPKKHMIYLGNASGDIHSAELFNADGDLVAGSMQSALQGASITSMANADSDAVIYINGSVSSKDSHYYMTSQSAKRLTIHRYQSMNSRWKQVWTSYDSGAGSWGDEGYATDTSGVPGNKGGFAIVPPGGVQSLPVNARITAMVTIVADSVVVPLTVMTSSSAECYGKAYYYLYNLSDGKFPNKFFYKIDNTDIEDNIPLGYGEASKLSITDVASTDKLVGYGVADKDLDLNSGIATSFIIRDPVTTGLRGWKEISR